MLDKKISRKRAPYTELALFLKKNNIPQSEAAKLLGKSVSAFNQNLNGTGGDFTISEVAIICKKYGLSAEDIFFNDRVSITTTCPEPVTA